MSPTLGLLVVPLIWGTTFVTVKAALDDASPLLFVGVRFALATVCAAAFVRRRPNLGAALAWGIPLGLVLGVAYAAQTIGLVTTTPSRSAFITGAGVVLIPVWGVLLLHRKPHPQALAGIALAVAGLFFITDPDRGAWVIGDSWTVVCGVLFALHVVLLTRFGRTHDVLGLLFSQLAVAAIIGLAMSPLVETPRLVWSGSMAFALVLTGVLASFVTTLLQLRYQPRVSPARTAVLFAMEPVFAALFAAVLVGERMGWLGWLGGGLIVAAMLISELTASREATREEASAG